MTKTDLINYFIDYEWKPMFLEAFMAACGVTEMNSSMEEEFFKEVELRRFNLLKELTEEVNTIDA